jgi:hypothetical protein
MIRQRGITITGLLMTLTVVALLALGTFKIWPALGEYYTIQKIFKNMAEDPQVRSLRTRAEMNNAWAARATVENISSLDGNLIEYTKETDGWVITAEYSRKVPLFRNVSLYFDFKPSSR